MNKKELETLAKKDIDQALAAMDHIEEFLLKEERQLKKLTNLDDDEIKTLAIILEDDQNVEAILTVIGKEKISTWLQK